MAWIWYLAGEFPYAKGAAIKKKKKGRSSHHSSVEMNPTSIHEDVGSIPGLTQWVKDLAFLWTVV